MIDRNEDAGEAEIRQRMRLERQARTGILRNLREPPLLPPRKAALTGKWMDLRSTRRLRRQGLDLALPAATVETPELRAALTRVPEEARLAVAAATAQGRAGWVLWFLAGAAAGIVLVALTLVAALFLSSGG